MGRRLLTGLLAVAFLISLSANALATRPATDQEIAEFGPAVRAVENVTSCAVPAGARFSSGCGWTPRPDYNPAITEARVSTLDETWASALVSPAPGSTEAAIVVFRHYPLQWSVLTLGRGCELAERTFGGDQLSTARVMPDLVSAMGCTPIIPTRLRCVDRYHNWLLSFEKPLQCLVGGPSASPLPDWMNIRELRWHRWGDSEGAWASGLLGGLSRGFIRQTKRELHPRGSGSTVSPAISLPVTSVRLTASGLVSCGTAYYYSRLRLSSALVNFSAPLPTCPDQAYVPR